MKKKEVYIIVIAAIISIACFCTSYVLYSSIPRHTPQEWVKLKHQEDSIKITKQTPKFAENYINHYLKEKNDITSSIYDDSLKSYKVNYRIYSKEKDADKTTCKYYTAWVRINFKINNGDYIVKPQIIRLIRYKHK